MTSRQDYYTFTATPFYYTIHLRRLLLIAILFTFAAAAVAGAPAATAFLGFLAADGSAAEDSEAAEASESRFFFLDAGAEDIKQRQ